MAIFCLCVLFFLNTGLSFSQTTPIPDSNFEQALIDLSIDTNGLNGNILNTDAHAVTNLDVSGRNIRNLSGINAFVNLQTLNCAVNSLTELNISDNPELIELTAFENRIININLSLNTKLKVVSFNSNLLNTIDVSGSLGLEELYLNLNNLEELDVTNNLNLKHLGCYSNNLANIDLTANPGLTVVHIGDNNLSTLNISQNVNLEVLTCQDNSLSDLFCATNSFLNYLDCRNNQMNSLNIGANPELESVFLGNNSLNEMDLVGASKLKQLYAPYNKISNLNLAHNFFLERVNIEGNNIERLDLRNGNNENIQEFILKENQSISCILVDDARAPYLSNWVVCPTCVFVENEEDCDSLSIIDSVLAETGMHPNPAVDTVSFTVNTDNAKVEIYTVNGQLVHSQALKYGFNEVVLNKFNSGLYIARISSGQTLEIKKLIIN